MATKITIEAIVNAPVDKVWDYWTKPEHIIHWNFADPSWQCPKVENNVCVGGKYGARMEAKDGSFGFDFNYVYDRVVLQQELSFTMEDGRKASTFFESKGDVTHVSTTFETENENPVDLQKFGWQAILNNFKSYTESEV
jgi:uncharacterized protein YndB with AHSA1/START domain